MDGAPPPPGNSYFIAVALSPDQHSTGYFLTTPPPSPSEPAGLFEAFDGVANCPPAAARVAGKGLVGGETGARLLVGEAERELPPDQFIYGSQCPSGNPISPQRVQHDGDLLWHPWKHSSP